jgi:hypothetical protein
MLNAKITLDKRAEQQLIAALQKLPLEFRQKFLLQAQKSSLRPVQKAAKQQAKMMTNSGPAAESIRTVKGRYVKATGGAYSVIEHIDKRYNRTRKLGKYTIPWKTNYAKIERFIINGTAAGTRTVGVRKRTRKTGEVYMAKAGGSSSGFVVRGRGGQYMKVKKIRYLGSEANDYMDVAFRMQMANAERKFADEVFDKLGTFVRKNGL